MRIRSFSPVTFVVLLFVLIGAGCKSGEPPKDDKLLVAVSINPLVSLAGEVGGDRVEVVRLVPPGASPHTYEPTPSQVAEIGRSDVLLLIGLGLEYWADDLVSAADNEKLLVVDTSANVEPMENNHHIWLDPILAAGQAELIRDAFSQVDPRGVENYRENAARFTQELQALDRELETEIGGWSQQSFVAFHPAWVYFARRYGLKQAAVVEETPGHGPSPAELTEIIETARRIGARAIFAEPQLPPRVAETIAEESGAQVLFLDPIGGDKAPDDYIDLIRYNVETMAKAMK
jgi:zinc transport system substrate-binding protein